MSLLKSQGMFAYFSRVVLLHRKYVFDSCLSVFLRIRRVHFCIMCTYSYMYTPHGRTVLLFESLLLRPVNLQQSHTVPKKEGGKNPFAFLKAGENFCPLQWSAHIATGDSVLIRSLWLTGMGGMGGALCDGRFCTARRVLQLEDLHGLSAANIEILAQEGECICTKKTHTHILWSPECSIALFSGSFPGLSELNESNLHDFVLTASIWVRCFPPPPCL